ncbi:hypothetical protein DM860_013235 [Cuscuta australis]|uniref:Uncharacterized protein n=1 Tax=Cuscuta australis TaxID=267555 RepID=A0A328DPT8_9ASTE|nr:hypothetical protein DM860_013235 [Cuscuta australis]
MYKWPSYLNKSILSLLPIDGLPVMGFDYINLDYREDDPFGARWRQTKMYNASPRQNVRYFRNQLDSLQFRNVNTIKKAERRLGKVPGAVAAEVRDSLSNALENVDHNEVELVEDEDEEMHGDEDEFDADEVETAPYFPQTDNTQPGQSTQEDLFGGTQFDTRGLGGDNIPVMDYWFNHGFN